MMAVLSIITDLMKSKYVSTCITSTIILSKTNRGFLFFHKYLVSFATDLATINLYTDKH